MSSTLPSPLPGLVSVYQWDNGWTMSRVVTPDAWKDAIVDLKKEIHRKNRNGLLMWPSKKLSEIYERITPWHPAGLDSFPSKRRSHFVLLDDEKSTRAVLVFDSYIYPSEARTDGTIPRLIHVLVSDGPRVLNWNTQGCLVDFVFSFVYADMFGQYSGIQDLVNMMSASWSMGLPRTGSEAAFQVLSDGPMKRRLDLSGAALEADWMNTDKLIRFLEDVDLYVREALLQALNPGYSSESVTRTRRNSNEHGILCEWKFQVMGESYSRDMGMIFQLVRDRVDAWSWAVFVEPRRYIGGGKDLVAILRDTGIASSREGFWDLIQDLEIPGETTFDLRALEPYILLNTLCPLFKGVNEFLAWTKEI